MTRWLPVPVVAEVVDPPLPAAIYARSLSELLSVPFDPVLGLSGSDLFGRARDVRFVALRDDDKVEVRGQRLLVDDGYPRILAASRRSLSEQLVLLCLYVVHEAAHLVQGIGRKARVTRLRGTGHEDELMHLDLQADLVAALVVTRVFPELDPDWVRDVQGRSISDFPTLATHSSASRQRKARRAVSLRVDHLLRRSRVVREPAGYLFVVLGPAAGALQVYASGPPTQLVAEVEIDEQDAGKLLAALDDGPDSLRWADDTLGRLLAEE